MDSSVKHCLCGQPYDASKFMIQCDRCREWFHGSCIQVREFESRDIDKFHCPQCVLICGPTVFKEKRNWHRHDYWNQDEENKPVQAGTATFIRELKQRHFPCAEDEIVVVRGQQLSLPYFVQNGFERPILIPSKDGLGLVMPPETFTVNDIMDYVGEDCPLDVIDVARQDDVKMTMKDWVTYFNSTDRERVYNVISLEFSNKRLSELVRPPSIIQKLSWVESHWPDKVVNGEENEEPVKPQVMKYCLMGMEDSYTDFHIDFGGTSVWYHILQGEKVFYLIRPTTANLALYERWMSSSNQTEAFFGDQVDSCFKVTLTRGQTLFIPSGWIHSVLTTMDSLVFGGNFLCSMNIPLQIQIHQMETRIKTPHKYKFPSFEEVHWFAAPNIAQQIRDFCDGKRRPPSYLIQGAKTLLAVLKSWSSEEKGSAYRPAPSGVNAVRVIKDLSREVRLAEKHIIGKKNEKDNKKAIKMIASPAKTRRSTNVAALPLTPTTTNVAPVAIKNESPPPEIQPRSTSLEIKASPSPPPVAPPPVESRLQPIPSKKADRTTPGRAFATTNAARRKAAAANRNNALKMRLSAEGKPGGAQQLMKRPPGAATGNVSKKDSVYDFVDSDEDMLVVDEAPSGKRTLNGKQRTTNKGSSAISLTSNSLPVARKSTPGKESNDLAPLKNKFSALNGTEMLPNREMEDKQSIAAKNGTLDTLLLACDYAGDPESTRISLEDDLSNSGRASPSTREAIQGMLSMSKSAFTFCAPNPSSSSLMDGRLAGLSLLASKCTPPSPPSPPTRHAPGARTAHGLSGSLATRLSPRKRLMGDEDDFEATLKNCHQDKDFIYFDLDTTEEDQNIFKKRGGKAAHDESWSPRARVNISCPKPDRPVREGVKKEAIESGLAAAAAKLADLPPPKRSYHRKKPPPIVKNNIADDYVPSTSSKRVAAESKELLSSKKPRKGFATAKQRLGKILKIHKMLH